MSEIKLYDCSPEEWDRYLISLPQPHFLQSSEWALVKSNNGWEPFYKIWRLNEDEIVAGAMILERRIKLSFLPVYFSIHYVPKGPLLDWSDLKLVRVVLQDLVDFSRKRKAIFIKIDPDIFLKNPILLRRGNDVEVVSDGVIDLLRKRNWIYSDSQIQFQNTMWIDLNQPSEDILATMKQKTRYNIRLALKKGVKIRIANIDEYPLIYQLYAQTSIRDDFVIRSEKYYLEMWEKFNQARVCDVLIAEFEGIAIAGLVLYHIDNRAFYVYGMTSDEHRNLMASYAIQWEAIQLAKQYGLEFYDLWGAPNSIDESDTMYGVYRFKLGLGAELVSTIGAWDFINNRAGFMLYQKVIPALLNVMRKAGRRKTAESLG